MRIFYTAALFLALSPLFGVYQKPGALLELFSKENALIYVEFSPEGNKKEVTLSLSGLGASRDISGGGIKGTASLSRGLLTLTLDGKTLPALRPKFLAEGQLVLWAQDSHPVRYIVPSSLQNPKNASLSQILNAQLQALASLAEEGYEEDGYAEEG